MKKQKYDIKESNKELVSLRRKSLTKGGYSLFLDYVSGGTRTKEYLKMYLVPERNRVDRLQNEETLKTANALKAKRTVELQNGSAGFRRYSGDKVPLTDFMEERAEYYAKRGSLSYAQTVRNVRLQCIAYKGAGVKLSQVKKDYILGFIEHLNASPLGEGTIYTYYTCLMIILNAAVRKRLIAENEAKYIEPFLKPKMRESDRAHLSLEEVQRLADTPCDSPDLKRAFLLSCFCGLRLSDIRTLTWEQIVPSGDGKLQIEKRQKKTGTIVYVPLSQNALKFLPEHKNGIVYPNLPSDSTIDRKIAKWSTSAGISKHITFHCARHTNATLLLEYGADIYTVSGILGHKNIRTTQIYAKIVDKKKREALDQIPELGTGGRRG